MKKLLFILILLLFNNFVFSQSFTIHGNIIDKQYKSPLIFVNIALLKEASGTISNDSGYFKLATPPFADTLKVSFVGYKSVSIPIFPHKNYHLKLEMESQDIQLSEVDVTPGRNPAFEILKQINKHKKQNDYYKYPEYKIQIYNKIEFALNNIDSSLFDNKALKPFDFMLNYADTSEFTGSKVLPVFMSETQSEYYSQRQPKRSKEIFLASKMSGVQNKSYSQFAGKMYSDLDIYQNIIPLFEKNFINPISAYARPYYKFLLMDSLWLDGNYCYYIRFIPRLKRELTFSGDMYIDTKSFAVKKIKARISSKANINYVKDLEVELSFQQIEGKYWFPKESTLKALLSLSDKQISIYGQKQTIYSHAEPRIAHPKKIFSEAKIKSKLASDSIFRDTNYWKKERPVDLSKMETGVYSMVDTMMKVPRFKFYQNFSTMIYSGYWEKGLFELGPYYTFYSYNAMEGNRYRIGGRTSNQFSTKIMLNGHLAYGDRDRKLKFGIGAWYVLKKSPRSLLKLNYVDDMQQLSNSSSAFMSDDILNSIFSVSENTDLLRNKAASIQLTHDWFDGLRSDLTIYGRDIYSSSYHHFQTATESFPFIRDMAIQFNTRFAFGEKYLEGEFERSAVPSDFPIINVSLMQAQAQLKPDYKLNYTKIAFNLEHNFLVGPMGYLEYRIDAGKLFGSVPYPLLELHAGNETYYLDNSAYNLMNYYEFASDSYASLMVTQHFDGFILSKIPLINTLKLRGLVFARSVYGYLSTKHQSIIQFPSTLYRLNSKPYLEAGVGIENLFKILRIDAIWRLSYTDHPNIQKFGIRAQIQVIL